MAESYLEQRMTQLKHNQRVVEAKEKAERDIPFLAELYRHVIREEQKLTHISQLDEWSKVYSKEFNISSQEAVDLAVKTHTIVSNKLKPLYEMVLSRVNRDNTLRKDFEEALRQVPEPVAEPKKKTSWIRTQLHKLQKHAKP